MSELALIEPLGVLQLGNNAYSGIEGTMVCHVNN